jgi:hypothetical protein
LNVDSVVGLSEGRFVGRVALNVGCFVGIIAGALLGPPGLGLWLEPGLEISWQF